jgi:hypothetical protein
MTRRADDAKLARSPGRRYIPEIALTFPARMIGTLHAFTVSAEAAQTTWNARVRTLENGHALAVQSREVGMGNFRAVSRSLFCFVSEWLSKSEKRRWDELYTRCKAV